jgi:putative spermidine/putrescine transport system permease protein
VVAEGLPRESEPLPSGQPDRGREHPQDGLGRARPQAQQRIRDDGLGSFRDAADEVQGPIVARNSRTPLGERRPREERRTGHVVRAQQHHRGEAGVGLGVRDPDHEPAVHGEVGDDVDEATAIGGTDTSGHRTVETVSQPIREPETQRQSALVDRYRHASAGAEQEPEERDPLGTDPASGGASGERSEWAVDGGPQPTIEHTHTPSSTNAGIPVGLLPALITLIVLFGGAIVGLVLGSLRPGAITGADLGLGDWRAVLHDDNFRDALGFTAAVAFTATVASTVLAVLGAAVLQHRPTWLRGAVASAVPMPHLVAASLAVTWLAPGGLAERLMGTIPFRVIGDADGLGIIAVYVFKEAPFLTLLILAAWDQQTRDLEEVAATLGAKRWARFRDVVLPRVAPPLAAGALIVAAFTLGATEVPLLVGPTKPDTIATYALTVVHTDGPVARARATAALVVVTALTLALGALAAMTQRRRTASR